MQNEKIIPVGLCDLLRYSSVRRTFLTFCLEWMMMSLLMRGLAIGIKNVPGNLYTNGCILSSIETVAYYFIGFLMNVKALGRKYALFICAFFYTVCSFCMFGFFEKKKYRPSFI